MRGILKYRKLIYGVNQKVPIHNGKFVTAINFDNAATTPPFNCVMEEINNFSKFYSSIHRGYGYKSMISSDIYENSRKVICDFLCCDSEKNCVIYGKNTTEAINKLSYIFYNIDKNAMILSTRMEHHSNDLPWRTKFKMEYAEVDEFGHLDIDDLERKLIKHNGKIKLVCVTGASNVTGYINPINQIASICHGYGAKIFVDGAQLIPHARVDMKSNFSKEHIDYIAFSSHKMYAPFGIGVLVGDMETFMRAEPEYCGGGTIKFVADDFLIWDDPPHKNEAGSPNVIGVVALIAAIKKFKEIGIDNIEMYEKDLYNYGLKEMLKVPKIKIYCDLNKNYKKVSIIPFNITGVSHEVTARFLSAGSGISVRSGCFCAQPYVQRLLNISKGDLEYYKDNPKISRPGIVRVSFGLYNSCEEVDVLIDSLKELVEN